MFTGTLETVTTDEGKEGKNTKVGKEEEKICQIKGRFGIHGGQYIPETLMNAVMELERGI